MLRFLLFIIRRVNAAVKPSGPALITIATPANIQKCPANSERHPSDMKAVMQPI